MVTGDPLKSNLCSLLWVEPIKLLLMHVSSEDIVQNYTCKPPTNDNKCLKILHLAAFSPHSAQVLESTAMVKPIPRSRSS
jgi:hypothetical protein